MKMVKRLNNLFYFILLILIAQSCNGQAKKDIKEEVPNLNFLDKKYFNGYSLIIDESNISEHPFFSYLDCEKEGYFAVHFIPKSKSLENYWKEEYRKNKNFESIDFQKESNEITDKVKGNMNKYDVFCYIVPKKYLKTNSEVCTEESVFLKPDAQAIVYLYAQNEKKWKKIASVKANVLPPYAKSDFFISLLTEGTKNDHFSTPDTYKEIERNDWIGDYTLNITYGKLDRDASVSIGYNVNITDSGCTFSGLGYKTFFTDSCTYFAKDKKLYLKFIKAVDGDGFSNHEHIDTLAVISKKHSQYYIKSPVIADRHWNYNSEVELRKIK